MSILSRQSKQRRLRVEQNDLVGRGFKLLGPDLVPPGKFSPLLGIVRRPDSLEFGAHDRAVVPVSPSRVFQSQDCTHTQHPYRPGG